MFHICLSFQNKRCYPVINLQTLGTIAALSHRSSEQESPKFYRIFAGSRLLGRLVRAEFHYIALSFDSEVKLQTLKRIRSRTAYFFWILSSISTTPKPFEKEMANSVYSTCSIHTLSVKRKKASVRNSFTSFTPNVPHSLLNSMQLNTSMFWIEVFQERTFPCPYITINFLHSANWGIPSFRCASQSVECMCDSCANTTGCCCKCCKLTANMNFWNWISFVSTRIRVWSNLIPFWFQQ